MSQEENLQEGTEDVLMSLLHAEREQEITQVTTLQGQIVALVLILKRAGIITKEQVSAWEDLCELVQNILLRMTLSKEVAASPSTDDPVAQVEVILDGLCATLEFMELMEAPEKEIEEVRKEHDALAKKLGVFLNGTKTDQNH